jgi:hypothetical protein
MEQGIKRTQRDYSLAFKLSSMLSSRFIGPSSTRTVLYRSASFRSSVVTRILYRF